jgi:hypothetical protein
MIALTSLTPSGSLPRQTACLASWRAAGLEPRSLNPEAEAAGVRAAYGVEVVVVEPSPAFERPLVPINAVLAEVARIDAPALLINADLELVLTPTERRAFVAATLNGLGYLPQFNCDPERTNVALEVGGIGAFVLQPRHAPLFAPSFLCLGQPWWDLWVPWVVAQHGERLHAPERPATFHQRHELGWNEDNWHRCAAEFVRATGLTVDEDEDFVYNNLALKIMDAIKSNTTWVTL